MDPAFQKAQLLYQQRRYDLAADACREFLAKSPQEPLAHALLGLCLVRLGKYAEATEEGAMAVHQGPDVAFCHYALGATFQERNRFEEAEASAKEAVRLAPADPDYWGLLAQTYLSRQRWKEGLAAADGGLQFDPEHAVCINLRTMALVQLGEKEAAARTMAEALQRNPHNAFSHANQGWTLLHQSKPREAMEHFREALRLNPNLEWAQSGMMAALKARYFLYRVMLRYYLWMSKFNRKGRWAIVIGLWVVIQLLSAANGAHPGLGPLVYPVLAAYVLFALASWLADPIFNLTLMVNPYGRYLLGMVPRICALLVGGLLLAGAALVAAWLVSVNDLLVAGGLLAGLLSLPVAAISRCRPGKHVLAMSLYTLAAAGVGVAAMVFISMQDERGINLFLVTAWGCVLSSLAANVLLNMIPRK